MADDWKTTHANEAEKALAHPLVEHVIEEFAGNMGFELEGLPKYGIYKVAMYAAQVARAQALGFDADLLRHTPAEATAAQLDLAARAASLGIPVIMLGQEGGAVAEDNTMTDERSNEQIIAQTVGRLLLLRQSVAEVGSAVESALAADGRLVTPEHEQRIVNLEAAIADAAMAMEKGLAEGATRSAIVVDVLAALSRAGDPVVLREHDAKVLRDAADAWADCADSEYAPHTAQRFLRDRAAAIVFSAVHGG